MSKIDEIRERHERHIGYCKAFGRELEDSHEDRLYLLNYITELEKSHWQPIETAPRNGTPILLFDSSRGIVEGWFAKFDYSHGFIDGWSATGECIKYIECDAYKGVVWVCADDAFKIEVEEFPDGTYDDHPITHWMPLPVAPETSVEDI